MVAVDRVELVGLVPARRTRARAAPAFLAWSGISENETIEARVALAASVAGAANPDAGPVPRPDADPAQTRT